MDGLNKPTFIGEIVDCYSTEHKFVASGVVIEFGERNPYYGADTVLVEYNTGTQAWWDVKYVHGEGKQLVL